MTQTLTAGDDSPPPHLNPPVPQDPAPVRVRPGSPAELLAVVPHLLGFMPQDSLVVMGTEPPRDRVKVTLRFDLPDPPGAGDCSDLAAHAVAIVGSQHLTAMTAVGYGPEALVTPVAYALRDAAGRAGIDLRDVLRVEDGRYWSYACGNEACCPAAGTPFDPRCSPIARRWRPGSRRWAASPRCPCARPPAGPNSTRAGCSGRSAGPAAWARPGR
jgi:Domain of unknown function (DUF4192)